MTRLAPVADASFRRGRGTSLRMLHLVEETQPLFGQAMRTRAVTQQADVAQRWDAVGFEAVGDVRHGRQRLPAMSSASSQRYR